jgi:hypothetical protein
VIGGADVVLGLMSDAHVRDEMCAEYNLAFFCHGFGFELPVALNQCLPVFFFYATWEEDGEVTPSICIRLLPPSAVPSAVQLMVEACGSRDVVR